jgi:hypothetical protein
MTTIVSLTNEEQELVDGRTDMPFFLDKWLRSYQNFHHPLQVPHIEGHLILFNYVHNINGRGHICSALL